MKYLYTVLAMLCQIKLKAKRPKKKAYSLIALLLCLSFGAMAQGQSTTTLKGRVADAQQEPLPNVNLKIGEQQVGITDKDGQFTLRTSLAKGILTFSAIGYQTQTLAFEGNKSDILIKLQEESAALQEVQVVSTGYQTLPKERATGSFVLVDSALLNQRVTTNILDRLDGVVAGLNFNRNLSGLANNAAIAIRGRSTIFGNPNPLIILDNFPYDGDLENINPNDIENVSILKDAAAASIWGVRAGNGVIVITTKKGKAGQVPSVSLTTNLSYQQRPDVFAQPWLSSAEYIDLEQYLYTKGYYNSALRNQYAPISPVVQLLANTASGQISSTAAQVLINQLKGVDVREQWDRYFYQDEWKQQHQLSVAGGSDKQRYYLAGGADQNRGNRVNEHFSRLTLNANNTYYLLKGKLELFTGIGFTQSNTLSATENYSPFTPYDLLANEQGEAMELGRYLRPSYTDTVGGGAGC